MTRVATTIPMRRAGLSFVPKIAIEALTALIGATSTRSSPTDTTNDGVLLLIPASNSPTPSARAPASIPASAARPVFRSGRTGVASRGASLPVT